LKDCVPNKLCVTTIITGDVNFSDDIIRFDGIRPDTKLSDFHKFLSSLWERLFGDFVEIAHDCPTFMRGAYLSQIDRTWTNVLPAILLDLSPSSSVRWELSDYLGSSSDHVPLRICFGNDGERVASIPKWVPKHPDFYRNCMLLCSKVGILPGSPFQVLQRHKAILLEAARITLSSASHSGFPVSLDQKIYWSMMLLRSSS